MTGFGIAEGIAQGIAQGIGIGAGAGVVTETITQDGLVMSFEGVGLAVSQDVLGNYIVRAPSGSLTINSLPTIDPTRTSEDVSGYGTANFVGNIMVDPTNLKLQGFDNRGTGGVGSGPGPTSIYSAGLAESLPLTVDVTGGPKTVLFYRGLDTVQNGGGNTGCAAIVPITITQAAPPANCIRPPIYAVTGGKSFITTGDINYDAVSQTAIPGTATEPDWDSGYYLPRGLCIQSGSYGDGTAGIGRVNPCLNQLPYPGDQAIYISRVALGAISDSSERNDLINRIVCCGRDIEIQTQVGAAQFVGGGGFGEAYGPLRFLAGVFLEDSTMMTRPDPIYLSLYDQTQEYFFEDAVVWLGVPEGGTWPNGKPLYGTLNSANYPTGPYSDNHDVRDVNGLREPHWISRSAGTAQGGTSSTIQLDAGIGDIVAAGYAIYITGGTGAGQVRQVDSWDNGTKTITVTTNWTTPPDATSTYEYYNGGSYQELSSNRTAAFAIALVLADLVTEYDNVVWLAYMKRWIEADGEIQPRYPVAYSADDYDVGQRQFWDGPRVWASRFYDVATSGWPTIPAVTVSTFSPLDDATDVAVDANFTATFSENIQFGTGTINLYNASDSLIESFDVETDIGGGAGTVSISGAVLTIEPTSDLAGATGHYIQIDATAIRTSAKGYYFAGIADKTTWNFTTESTAWSVSSAGASGSPGALGGFTMATREFALTPGYTVNTIGVYSGTSATIEVKVVRRDSATQYDVLVSETLSHGGTGWEDKTLSSPYAIPDDGGTYYVAAYSATGIDRIDSTNRTYITGDQSVANDITGWTEDNSNTPVMRAAGTT